MEKLGEHFSPRFTFSSHPGLVMIPKSTAYMRIIIVDEELPLPIDMHLIRGAIPDIMHKMPYDSGWSIHLQEMTEMESVVRTSAEAISTRVGNTNVLLSQINMRRYYETVVAPRAAKATNSCEWVGYVIVFAIIIWWKWLK
jgi:hypothetical protein